MEKEIARHILSAKASPKKKIKIILGDFLSISDVHHPKKIIGKDPPFSEEDHDNLWQKYEKVRFITNNECPSFVHFVIHKLCEQGLVDSIITTNYDQYLESIYERILSSYKLIRNPVLPTRLSYDWEGYYSRANVSRKRSIKFFKIHGSFSHIVFIKCPGRQAHIFQLPKFLTAFSTKDIRKELRGKSFHFKLSHQDIDGADCKDTGYYVHFMDWLLDNRSAFEKEIAGSIANLLDTSDTEMIFSLGFTGRPDEELNDCLLELAKKKFPLYYVISETQFQKIKPRGNYLYHHLQRLNPMNISVVDDFDEFLKRIFKECGENPRKLDAEYGLDWQSSNIFVPSSEIGGYVK